jgi:hypothetical protein
VRQEEHSRVELAGGSQLSVAGSQQQLTSGGSAESKERDDFF